jgi:hypothetical protein
MWQFYTGDCLLVKLEFELFVIYLWKTLLLFDYTSSMHLLILLIGLFTVLYLFSTVVDYNVVSTSEDLIQYYFLFILLLERFYDH